MGSSILIWSHWYDGTLSDSESFKLFTSPLLKRCVLMWINEWCILNGYWISVILFYVHPGYGERTLPAWPPEVILFYLCAATVPALMLHPCFNQCYKKKKKKTPSPNPCTCTPKNRCQTNPFTWKWIQWTFSFTAMLFSHIRLWRGSGPHYS